MSILKSQPKFQFKKGQNSIMEANANGMYELFKGYTSDVKYNMPATINFNEVFDKVKFFSYNYSIAGAVGIVTDGIYKFLAANTVKEISLTIKDFGKEAKKGQRYVDYDKLIRATKVVPRLGGGQMRISVCTKYEVVEFFRRLKKLDINALNKEDMDAMKADMQVIGRVIQEIAIDVAKNKDLSAGIDPMNTFGSIMVLSKLRSKFKTSVTDNTDHIFQMVRESISKNEAISTGVEIESVPAYSMNVNNFEDKEHIVDWGSEYQDALIAKQEEFFNTEIELNKIGTTVEDLAIKNLVLTYEPLAREIKHVYDMYFAYDKTLRVESDADADTNHRNAINRKAADKTVKAAFRDTVYALGRAYGLNDSDIRKIAYGATMLRNGEINIANLNLSCINVLGEEDTLLMWSNEEGIVRDAVEVDLSDYAMDNIDFTQEVAFQVEFIDDVAYDADGNEIAYGCFTDLNCKGILTIENNKAIFTPERDKELAPIGNKRVALINRVVINNELKSIYTENARIKELFELAQTNEDLLDAQQEQDKLEAAIKKTIDVLVAYKDLLFFVGKTGAGVENAVCVRVLQLDENGQPKKDANGNDIYLPSTIGKAVAVGKAYGADLFNKGLSKVLPTGQTVALTNKMHTLENIIKTENGLLLVLGC